jgi:hypothetical protein
MAIIVTAVKTSYLAVCCRCLQPHATRRAEFVFKHFIWLVSTFRAIRLTSPKLIPNVSPNKRCRVNLSGSQVSTSKELPSGCLARHCSRVMSLTTSRRVQMPILNSTGGKVWRNSGGGRGDMSRNLGTTDTGYKQNDLMI